MRERTGKVKGKGFGEGMNAVMNMTYESDYKDKVFDSCKIFIILVTIGSFINIIINKEQLQLSFPY